MCNQYIWNFFKNVNLINFRGQPWLPRPPSPRISLSTFFSNQLVLIVFMHAIDRKGFFFNR